MTNINQTDLRVESCTLRDFLVLTNGGTSLQPGITSKICIPEYQRPYVWKEKQVKKLLFDLVDYQNDTRIDKPLYYLGSFILQHDEEKKMRISAVYNIFAFFMLFPTLWILPRLTESLHPGGQGSQ